jgi:hypothetical protein
MASTLGSEDSASRLNGPMLTYLKSTCHPWVSLLFLVPLLAAYEGGILWLGGDRTYVAAQADAWVRGLLENYGAAQVYAAPVVVIDVLLIWSWCRWSTRPEDPVTTCFGMAFESAIFAFLLWQFSRNFGPIIDHLGVKLEVAAKPAPAAQILTFVGAGIYEEVLFRLGLFSVSWSILRSLHLPGAASLLIAATLSALAFAAAHHVGKFGEPMQPYVFLFRVLAGLYFAGLFALRGFGIAVGAHVGYDVLVGVTV